MTLITNVFFWETFNINVNISEVFLSGNVLKNMCHLSTMAPILQLIRCTDTAWQYNLVTEVYIVWLRKQRKLPMVYYDRLNIPLARTFPL